MLRRLAVLVPILLAAPAHGEAPLYEEEPAIAWERMVGGAGADRIAALAAMADGTVAAAGARVAEGEEDGDAWIALYDREGKERWSRSMGGDGDQAITSLTGIDGGVAAVGEDQDGPLVAAYDLDGGRRWAGADALEDDDMTLAAGGALALAGAVRDGRSARGLAVGLDPATGGARWRFADKAEGDSVFLALDAAGEDLLVTGWAETGGDIVRKRPILLRMDGTGGSLRWRRTLGPDDEEGAFHALALRADGGAILAGMIVLSTGHPQPRAMAVNADGDFVWEFRPGERQGTALAAVPLADGGALLGGYLADRPRLTRRAWLARIDATGDALWEKTFVAEGDAAIRALALSADGRLTAGGSRLAGARGEDGWIFQLR